MREPRPTREEYDKLKLEVELLREERDFLRVILYSKKHDEKIKKVRRKRDKK